MGQAEVGATSGGVDIPVAGRWRAGLAFVRGLPWGLRTVGRLRAGAVRAMTGEGCRAAGLVETQGIGGAGSVVKRECAAVRRRGAGVWRCRSPCDSGEGAGLGRVTVGAAQAYKFGGVEHIQACGAGGGAVLRGYGAQGAGRWRTGVWFRPQLPCGIWWRRRRGRLRRLAGPGAGLPCCGCRGPSARRHRRSVRTGNRHRGQVWRTCGRS